MTTVEAKQSFWRKNGNTTKWAVFLARCYSYRCALHLSARQTIVRDNASTMHAKSGGRGQPGGNPEKKETLPPNRGGFASQPYRTLAIFEGG